MKSFALVTIMAAAPLLADSFTVDKSHSEATFKVRHLLSKISGRFDDFSGTIKGDPKKPASSSVEFNIKTASINTGTADRDKDLRGANFFDAEKYPEITFKSTSIKSTRKKNVYAVTGNLTMHGVTKKITMPVEYLGMGKDPWGNEKAGFSVDTKLSRKDYGVSWNKALDNGGVLVGDDVEIAINIEAAKDKAAVKDAAAKEKSR